MRAPRAFDAATTDNLDELQTLARDDDARVRAIALATMVRIAPRARSTPLWKRAATDTDARVRLRAAQLAPALGRSVPNASLLALLADGDAWVAEAAAYAIGEHPRTTRASIDALVRVATTHDDPLLREAAVAALGSIGDAATLPAVLHACDDKPAIRRRAVLALASFDGDAVEARLHAALEDHDWQVRQAAEDLLGPDAPTS